jgi:hypothetical protein
VKIKEIKASIWTGSGSKLPDPFLLGGKYQKFIMIGWIKVF